MRSLRALVADGRRSFDGSLKNLPKKHEFELISLDFFIFSDYAPFLPKNVVFNRTYANCVNKQGISPKASLFPLFNPLNPPYQGDFERKCVSPI